MVVFLFNIVIYVFLLLCLCILIVCLCIFIVPPGTLRLLWLRFFRAFSSVVRQMPGYNSQRRGTARTLQTFCVVLCIVRFVSFSVLFLCKCVLYYCHRVNTQLQLTNISHRSFLSLRVGEWKVYLIPITLALPISREACKNKCNANNIIYVGSFICTQDYKRDTSQDLFGKISLKFPTFSTTFSD